MLNFIIYILYLSTLVVRLGINHPSSQKADELFSAKVGLGSEVGGREGASARSDAAGRSRGKDN
jgi:hypothetical protein